MFYNSSKYDSIFDWLFSLSGIICLLLFIGVIWLVVRFMNNTEKKDKEVYLPPSNKYENENEYASDNSFWDDIRESQDNNPQREEEPIPPNAIQPTPNLAIVTNEVTYATVENSEMEKDCTKPNVTENFYADQSAINQLNFKSENEEKGE